MTNEVVMACSQTKVVKSPNWGGWWLVMDETMLGKSSWETQLWEREHKQRVKEVINETILEGGLEVKEKEVMPLAVGDINLKED
jgi:hypothetical protein